MSYGAIRETADLNATGSADALIQPSFVLGAEGYEVSGRGLVSRAVVEAYRAAGQGDASAYRRSSKGVVGFARRRGRHAVRPCSSPDSGVSHVWTRCGLHP